jgi:hypothetical protein
MFRHIPAAIQPALNGVSGPVFCASHIRETLEIAGPGF